VRDFVVDHEKELAKLSDICQRDCTIEVRIAKANPASAIDLNSKFGCDGQTATSLMRRASDLGFDVALAMHVGWQAPNPEAWSEAMAMGAGCAEAAGVCLKYANLGGGYPTVLMPKGRKLEDFFATIKSAKAAHMSTTNLNCEPGSALAWTGGATIARVQLRKEGSLYLNDGIYGTMSEIKFSAIAPPAIAYKSDGSRFDGAGRAFTVFGPTCDSLDTLPTRIELPDAIDEGDYVVFGRMGAYSNALLTDFNGVGQLSYAAVDEFPV
jgi:ornithine decarboxylase